MEMSRSLRILLSNIASHATTTALMYSVFVLESAIVGNFLLPHDMASIPREKTKPEVDRRSAL